MDKHLVKLPEQGEIIQYSNGRIIVPKKPIVSFIEGDGIGADITPTMQKVVDAAIWKAYGDEKKIVWLEVFAGEKAKAKYDEWLPKETLEIIKKYKVAIKGPLTTPIGGGMRSLSASLRQIFDLYVCLRPVRYFKGAPSPLLNPEKTDMVIFRENAEDIYTGIEWKADSIDVKKLINFLQTELDVNRIRFPKHCGIGIKHVSKEGTQRLVKAAIKYAIEHNKDSVTLVHKGNIMKYTEGAFKEWGYEVAIKEFGARPIDDGSWHEIEINGKKIIIKDVIADAFFQQILLRPEAYSVIATLNLNGDYLSDALAAQIGGIGIAPSANLSDELAIFEASHGTAPKYAGFNKVNPSSLILSAEMMLRHLGWNKAANIIMKGLGNSIQDKYVTYDFARLLDGANEVSCSVFGDLIIKNM